MTPIAKSGIANAVRATRPHPRLVACRPVEDLASQKAHVAKPTTKTGRPTLPPSSQPGIMYSAIEPIINAGERARKIDIGKAVISLITILLSRQLARTIEINWVNMTKPAKNAT